MWILIGKFFMAIGVILMGPSFIFGYILIDSIYIMTLGICILGFSTSFNLIPLFPLLIKEIKQHYNVNTCEVTDLASGLYTAAFGVGTIIGPLTGAYLEMKYGF
jgi:MFS family permease